MMSNEIVPSNKRQMEVIDVHAEKGGVDVLFFTANRVESGQRVKVIDFDEGRGEAASSGNASIGDDGEATPSLVYNQRGPVYMAIASLTIARTRSRW